MKRILIPVLIIASIAIIGVSFISTSGESFNFSLKYGVDGKNFVSTIDNSLKADTIEGIKSIGFEFSKKDIERVKNKIIELEIMETDFKGMPISDITISTMGIYTLTIELDGKTKTVYWTTQYANFELPLIENKNENRYKGDYGRVYRLFDLKDFILEIIDEYEEYKKLPATPIYL